MLRLAGTTWGPNAQIMVVPGFPCVLLCRANKAPRGAEPGTGCRSREVHRHHRAKRALASLAGWTWLPSSHGSQAEAQSLMMSVPAMSPQALTHSSGVSRKSNLPGFQGKLIFIPLNSTDCLTTTAAYLKRPPRCSSLTERKRLPSNSFKTHLIRRGTPTLSCCGKSNAN